MIDMPRKLTTQELKQRTTSKTNGEYEFVGNYSAVNEKALFRHVVCGCEFPSFPKQVWSGQVKCPECSNRYIVIKGTECKKCSKCDSVKPLTDFAKDKRSKDGHTSTCKECKKQYNKKYRKENLEQIKESQKQYYKENCESRKEYQKQYSKEHRESQNESGKKWRKKNPEKVALKDQRRRAREKSLPDDLKPETRTKIFAHFNNTCPISGANTNLHHEHFIPLCVGHGGTTAENIYPMEGSLNLSKNGSNPFEWIKSQPQEYQENFYNILVPYLAKVNNMEVAKFTDFVYWCFDNPRTPEQTEADNEKGLTSKDLFYNSLK